MRSRVFCAAALLMATTGAASATVVEPSLGVVATGAVVDNNGRHYTDTSYPLGFHSTGGVGTPGFGNGNSTSYFGTTASASSGYDAELSGNNTNRTFASGRAAVDLNSGQMHLVGQAQRLGSGNDLSAAAISALAAMSDVVTVTGAITTPVTVRLSMIVDGSIVAAASNGGALPTDMRNTLAAFELLTNRSLSNGAELFLNNFDGSSVQEQDVSAAGSKVVTDGGNASHLQFTLYDDFVLTDAMRTFSFEAIADINLVVPDAAGTITADFGNTARLQLSLPAGLSFTSRSGVLLTAPQDVDPGSTSVPEPASLLLLAAGLPALGLVRRRDGRAGAGRLPA